MKTKIVLIALIFGSSLTFGQTKLADKFFKNYQYVKAIEHYSEYFDKKEGDVDSKVLTALGDCYYNIGNPKTAAEWYEKALVDPDDVSAKHIYRYIQTQLTLENYDVANTWLKTFNERFADDSRAQLYDSNTNKYSVLAEREPVLVEIENVEKLNSNYSDFGSFIFNDVLYFASSRNTEGKIYKWNEQPYLDIYQAKASLSDDGSMAYGDVGFITSEEVNSDFHGASVAITQDGKTMYFTGDNLKRKNRLDYDKKGTAHLKIYKASLVDGSWANVQELPFNSDDFSTGHPALSPDDKKLYFVSDRPLGEGQTDIFEVDILENDSYSTPKRVEGVNSDGREMFPFVAKDSTLYFSSDGYLNYGLLDIFKSDVLKGKSDAPENLGAPYNTGYDDFAYFINSDTNKGFLSSNRPGGKGNDDIYSFGIIACKQLVKGVVRNAETSEPLNGATVQKISKSGVIIETYTTNENGEYSFEVDCDETYTILGLKEDYKNDFKNLNTTKENDFVNKIDLNLIPLIKDNQIVINPIFFDFDKWNIRTDAQYELENIVDVLRQHPTMIIKIESHTDSRGSDRYNIKLSNRRATSTRDYIYSRGIEKYRIASAVGYGETQLLNECEDGVRCSEEKHQENRRSYFYILKD
ncbi:MAG: OmpA family protein [Flavobacteriaceae bacterium]|nr:OmpA family protein [Flavobacteriaceae bacterium]